MRPTLIGANNSRRLRQYPFVADNLPHALWRITSLTIGSSGTLLEISELQLFSNGGTVNQNNFALKTSSHVPASDPANPLSYLFDGNLSTKPNWTKAVAEQGTSFWIKWDFGGVSPSSTANIDGVKQGGGDDPQRSLRSFSLQYFDDELGTWLTKFSKSGLTHPGNSTLSSLYTA